MISDACEQNPIHRISNGYHDESLVTPTLEPPAVTSDLGDDQKVLVDGLADPSTSNLSTGDLVQIYYNMVLSRALSERMWQLNRLGKAHIVITCEGHEGAQVGSAYAIRAGHDYVLPYYRDIGVVLTLGMTAREIMLGALHRAADPNSGGRQMPAHWSHSDLRIISQSSVVATHILHAVGIAHAGAIKGDGTSAVVYFGDGATSKGDFHEGLNWAALFNLPVVFVCENNEYAISTPFEKQSAVPRVADRAAAYGIPGVTVDGSDVVAVHNATRTALKRAGSGLGPTLLEIVTYRFAPHTSNDNDTYYRTREEIEAHRHMDPLTRFRAYLLDRRSLTDEQDQQITERAQDAVDDAEEFAESCPVPRPEDA